MPNLKWCRSSPTEFVSYNLNFSWNLCPLSSYLIVCMWHHLYIYIQNCNLIRLRHIIRNKIVNFEILQILRTNLFVRVRWIIVVCVVVHIRPNVTFQDTVIDENVNVIFQFNLHAITLFFLFVWLTGFAVQCLLCRPTISAWNRATNRLNTASPARAAGVWSTANDTNGPGPFAMYHLGWHWRPEQIS